MSQQEFIPASQDNEEPQTQSYSQYRTSDMPKRDHPSDYSSTIPAYSYQAQDTVEAKQQQAQSDRTADHKQQGRYSAPQQAGTQQQTFDMTRRLKELFTQQRQRIFQNQNWNGRSSVPPYLRAQPQKKASPNWFAILAIAGLLLLVLPLLLKLLFVLFVVLFIMGTFLLLLVISAILIYIFYFKKRWQRSRWWHW